MLIILSGDIETNPGPKNGGKLIIIVIVGVFRAEFL